jgi:hypothetical protein
MRGEIAMNRQRRDKIRDEMLNMLWACAGGNDPLENKDEGDLAYCLGAKQWLEWCSALRERYAKQDNCKWAFMPTALDSFLTFDDACENIYELIDNEERLAKEKR